MDKPLILVVDDEESARELFSLWLEEAGYQVLTGNDVGSCLRVVAESEPEAVILDLRLPPGAWGGLDALASLGQQYPSLPVIIVSSKADVKKAAESIRLGAYDFIDKNDALDQLVITVANALRLKRLEQKAARLEEENRILASEQRRRFSFSNLVGGSDQIQEVYRLIERVAPADASVLILGETGTGKELVAGALHYQSHRRQGSFIKVNCAALPDALLENELFGHEKGAFTGATHQRAGRFELADGGTIFLDEVADMSLATQAKVLRVLQGGSLSGWAAPKP